MAPSNGDWAHLLLGYPADQSGGALPQSGHRAGTTCSTRCSPSALCRGQVYVEASGAFWASCSAQRLAAPLNWPGSGSCWSFGASRFLADPLALAGPAVPAHPSAHIKELFVFCGQNRDVPSDNNPADAQPAPSGYQPQGQRRHPVGTWSTREQDDAGIGLRHLARTSA